MVTISLILILAYGGKVNPIQSQSENEEQILTLQYPNTLGPGDFQFLTATERYIYGAVMASLYIYHFPTSDQLIPELADGDPIISSDGKTYTVNLNKDLKFSNGNSLTADDVVFSYNVYLTPEINWIWYDYGFFYPAIISYLESNNSIIAIDSSTVQFKFQQTSVKILDILTFPIIEKASYIDKFTNCGNGVSEDCRWQYDETTAMVDIDDRYMQGAGPFMFESFVNKADSQTLILVKNPNYHNKEVWADKLVFEFLGENSPVTNKDIMANGETDIFVRWGIPFGFSHSDLNGFPDYTTLLTPARDQQRIELNLLHPYFGSGELIPDGNGISNNDEIQAIQIRHAISHILDREYIINELAGFQGNGIPGVTPILPFIPGFNSNLPPHTFSLETARSYMENAGFNFVNIIDVNNDGDYGDPGDTTFFNVTLLSPYGNPAREKYANYTEFQLPKIGIGVSHERTSFPNMRDRSWGWAVEENVPLYDEGGYDILFVGYNFDATVKFQMGAGFHGKGLCSNSDLRFRCTNFINYQNAELDNLIDSYDFELFDSDNRVEIMGDIQQILYDEMPTITLYYSEPSIVLKKEVSGVDPIMWPQVYTAWQFVKKEGWTNPATNLDDNDDVLADIPAVPAIVGGIVLVGLVVIGMQRRK
jgi:peptide/nickel transport system substrate-binding protein